MANRALLLALDSTDPPADHDGMYPTTALLAANCSVPVLWLSLFGADDVVTWPGTDDGPPFTTVAQTTSKCAERSRTRLEDWSRRWPNVFRDMSEPWLGYIGAVEKRFLAVWAEELSGMTGDDQWAADLRAYLGGLDDPDSPGFREALAQSYLFSPANGLEPFDTVGLVTAGYTWSRQASWQGAGHGPFWQGPVGDHSGCQVCGR
jgi:hypothetical protein